MDHTFQKIPFLRIALAFATGILIGKNLEIPERFFLPALILVFSTLVFLKKVYNYKLASSFGFFVHLFFLLLGTSVFNNYNTPPHYFEKGIFLGTVLESPQKKQNSYKSIIQLTSGRTNDSTFLTKEKVLVYFAKGDRIKNIKPGAQILINTPPQEIQNNGNPYEFDYKGYLKNKRIYRQIYLSNNDWKTTHHTSTSLWVRAELLRERLLNIYRNQNLGANETEILSALTLGYKRDLDTETKRVFSAAGAMHVLAVSGLHVGIIFMVLNFLLGFLKRQKTGRYIFVCSTILILWIYAFITGLSPSVLRASTMFSIVIVATNLKRRASIYNSLAASALFLLLLNPNNLFEVGFQLSYSAVFGIVFLQPKIERLWPVKNKIVQFFWSLICVSIAAQIATFPLTAYYFNQFPAFFLFTNMIIIPAVMLLIPMGIFLLILSKIGFISATLSFLLKWTIKGIYFVLQFIESLPYSTIDISIFSHELLLLLFFLFFMLIFIKNKKAAYLKLALSTLLVFSVSIFLTNLQQHIFREIIVLNNAKNPTIQLVTGRKTYILSKYKIKNNDYLFRQIQGIQRKKRLSKSIFLQINEEYEDDVLFLKDGILFFEGKTIALQSKHKILPSAFFPDYLIVEQYYKFDLSTTNHNTKVICTKQAGNPQVTDMLYILKTMGAFHDKWKPKKTLHP